MATRRTKKFSGYIDQKYLVKMFKESSEAVYREDALRLLAIIREEVSAALAMLGHAKDTADSLRSLIDDGSVEDDDIVAFGMYLEDDIDEIENGAVYDLLKSIDGVISGDEEEED